MLFNLIVSKLEHLQAIWEGRLSCFSFSKIVNYSLISIGLLDVAIVEIDNSVTIRENFTLYSIIENNFFLAILINSLNFSIMSDDLLNNFHVYGALVMILLRELHIKVFFIFSMFLNIGGHWGIFLNKILSLRLLLLLLLLLRLLDWLLLLLLLLLLLSLILIISLLNLLLLELLLLLLFICRIVSFVNISLIFFIKFFLTLIILMVSNMMLTAVVHVVLIMIMSNDFILVF